MAGRPNHQGRGGWRGKVTHDGEHQPAWSRSRQVAQGVADEVELVAGVVQTDEALRDRGDLAHQFVEAALGV